MEAPSGFEPEMEVLQTSPGSRFRAQSVNYLSVSTACVCPDPPETAVNG
jgi:hypothetical protein